MNIKKLINNVMLLSIQFKLTMKEIDGKKSDE